MKNLRNSSLFIIFIILFSVALAGCSKTNKVTTSDDKKTTEQQTTEQPKNKIDTSKLVKDGKYVCSMHPVMQSNEPMKCPICKMNMVTKKELNDQMSEEHESMESKFAGTKNAIHFEVNLSVVKSSACQTLIESALKNDAGILGFHVDILNRVVHMYFDKTKTTKANIEKLVSDAGYDANNTKANPDAFAKLPADCR